SVSAASATADFEAINAGLAEPEASTSATFSSATTVLSVALTSDRPTGQALGSIVTWTATPRGGTSPLSYKWMVSFDDGASWAMLQNWTPGANHYAWTPTAATTRVRVGG